MNTNLYSNEVTFYFNRETSSSSASQPVLTVTLRRERPVLQSRRSICSLHLHPTLHRQPLRRRLQARVRHQRRLPLTPRLSHQSLSRPMPRCLRSQRTVQRRQPRGSLLVPARLHRRPLQLLSPRGCRWWVIMSLKKTQIFLQTREKRN